MATSKRVTAVIPVFNEADNVPILIRRLDAVAAEMGADYSFTYLFVNDGSTDATCSLLKTAHETNPAVRYLSLSRNFGHQAALSAGLQHCPDSDFIVMMDGDLQDSPAAIPTFIEQAKEGFDVIYAVRGSRPEGIIKRACYRLVYKLANAQQKASKKSCPQSPQRARIKP